MADKLLKNNRKIYIDLDGVIIDSNKIIKKLINDNRNKNFNLEKFCASLNWKHILKNSKEIDNNIKTINDYSKKYDITILTHVYSNIESKIKEKYIKLNFKYVKYIAVPYNIKKCDFVNSYNAILIDDYNNNINWWNNNGGMGILFKGGQNRLDTLLDDLLK